MREQPASQRSDNGQFTLIEEIPPGTSDVGSLGSLAKGKDSEIRAADFSKMGKVHGSEFGRRS